MQCSPNSSPFYGLDVVTVTSTDAEFDFDTEYFISFEGKDVRNTSQAVVLDSRRLQTAIPNHGSVELCTVTVLCLDGARPRELHSEEFRFTEDRVGQLCAFLAENADSLPPSLCSCHALNLREKLDETFECGLRYQKLTWRVDSATPRTTLLHFAAALGLWRVTKLLASFQGAQAIMEVRNREAKKPSQMARERGHEDLACWLESSSAVVNEVEALQRSNFGVTVMRTESNARSLTDDLALISEFSQMLVASPTSSRGQLLVLSRNSEVERLADRLMQIALDQIEVTAIMDVEPELEEASTPAFKLSRSNTVPILRDIDGQFDKTTLKRFKSFHDFQGLEDSGLAITIGAGDAIVSTTKITASHSITADDGSTMVTSLAFCEHLNDHTTWTEWLVTQDFTASHLEKQERKYQDSVWEFIRTEKLHLEILRTLDQVYRRGMEQRLGISPTVTATLFPHLDELIALHTDFLQRLVARQDETSNREVAYIGDLIMTQFSGDHLSTMERLYGRFFVDVYPAKKMYNQMYDTDKKFSQFVNNCAALKVTRKMGIQESILKLTQRVTQMPLLVSAIGKYVPPSHTTERETIARAQIAVKNLALHVNLKVDRYTKNEQLNQIFRAFDPRHNVMFENHRFSRQDLKQDGREMEHYGVINVKTSRGLFKEFFVCVLTDIILIMQQKDNRYILYPSGSRCPVLPCNMLLLKEKPDKSTKTFFLIVAHEEEPVEVWEFQANSADMYRTWLRVLRTRISECGTASGDQSKLIGQLFDLDKQMEDVASRRSAVVRQMLAACEVYNGVESDVVVDADKKIRAIINDGSSLLEDTTMDNGKPLIPNNTGKTDKEPYVGTPPEYQELYCHLLEGLHQLLPLIAAMQTDIADLRLQLSDNRKHPEYVKLYSELQAKDVQHNRAVKAWQKEQDKQQKHLNDRHVKNTRQMDEDKRRLEQRLSEVEVREAEVAKAHQKNAHNKEILQNQIDVFEQYKSQQLAELQQFQLMMPSVPPFAPPPGHASHGSISHSPSITITSPTAPVAQLPRSTSNTGGSVSRSSTRAGARETPPPKPQPMSHGMLPMKLAMDPKKKK